eukprot:CAMPEP_0114264670 /NCGR_PEP_ID=MMETSP0058-20121206/23357_1 /TAXON_ID=36894 /ORGANISM="Pyramimonas parkeae, CCMP726" /LENGTH=205 /DNA_ID=CAMNT_0001381413 /DNA_START=195 /DNA_END=814 /DNA_ORIENTATION=+
MYFKGALNPFAKLLDNDSLDWRCIWVVGVEEPILSTLGEIAVFTSLYEELAIICFSGDGGTTLLPFGELSVELLMDRLAGIRNSANCGPGLKSLRGKFMEELESHEEPARAEELSLNKELEQLSAHIYRDPLRATRLPATAADPHVLKTFLLLATCAPPGCGGPHAALPPQRHAPALCQAAATPQPRQAAQRSSLGNRSLPPSTV